MSSGCHSRLSGRRNRKAPAEQVGSGRGQGEAVAA